MKISRKLLLTSLCGLAAVGFYACGSAGQQGEPGAAGAKGDSCLVVTNNDGTTTIKCTDGSSFNIVNGHDGNPGDAGSDGKDGQNGQPCYKIENSDGSLAIVCPADGTSFIVRGNPDHYANYCKKGFWGKNCENECTCKNGGICNDGVNGDGSCSCIDAWTDKDCSVCPAGFYDGVTKCVDCTKGVANSAFDTDKCTFTDIRTNSTITDKNTYKVVTINGKFWMAENLKAQLDVSGNKIDCHANTGKDQNFVENYGCLYVWKELAIVNNEVKPENTNRICPSGWHLPTKEEFEQLLTATGADSNSSSIRDLSWTDGSNSSGFGALPAGASFGSTFYSFGAYAFFWSSTPNGNGDAYCLSVKSYKASVSYDNRDNGLSVRCLRDEG